MSHSVCPWWLGYFSISPLGRWSQNPAEILDGYLRQDITALEPGPVWDCSCSNCFDRVGPSGKVVAVDIQTLSCSRAETSRGQGWPSEPSRRPFSISRLDGSRRLGRLRRLYRRLCRSRRIPRCSRVLSSDRGGFEIKGFTFAGGAPRPGRIREVRKPVGCSPPERLRSALAAFGAAQPCSFSARVSESEQLVLL